MFTERSDGKEVNSVGTANRYEWRRMHRMLAPLFTSKKVMQMGPLVELCCARMIKRLDKQLQDCSTIDVYKLFGHFTMEAILTIAFGRDLDSQSDEGKHLFECLGILGGTGGGTGKDSKWGFLGMTTMLSHARWTISLFRALVKQTPIAESWRYLSNVARMMIDERSKQNTNRADLLQGLLKLMNNETCGDTFSKAEVVLNTRTLILAGFETTRNALSMTCYSLAVNHKIQEKAFDEIDKYFAKNPDTSIFDAVQSLPCIEMVLLEALRYHPPLKNISRHCVETCAVSDTDNSKRH